MKFLADENFDNRIVRGLLRRLPDLDIVRVQDLEIAGADEEIRHYRCTCFHQCRGEELPGRGRYLPASLQTQNGKIRGVLLQCQTRSRN